MGGAAGSGGGRGPGNGDGNGGSRIPPQGLKPRGISPHAHSAANAARLRAELALKDANILDLKGRLTEFALQTSISVMKPEDVLQNPSVVQELTKDGSSINDWGKFTTTVPVSMPTGQPIQVHFYRNIVTGKVNYTHQDFKIKEEVGLFYGRPAPEPNVGHGV